MVSANVNLPTTHFPYNYDKSSLVTGEAGSGQVAQRDLRPSTEGSEKAGLPANYRIPKTGWSRKNHSWSDSQSESGSSELDCHSWPIIVGCTKACF